MKSILAILIFCGFHSEAISKTSNFGMENVAAVVGQPTRVVCTSNSTGKVGSLKLHPTGQKNEIPVWSDQVGLDDKLSRKSITFRGNNNSIVEMIINSSSKTDAGTYNCTVLWNGEKDGTSTLRFSAQMIVLDENLSCKATFNDSTTVNEFDIVQMECRIEYTGNWAPVMQWRLNSEDGLIISEGNETSIVQTDSVTSVLRLVAFRHLDKAKCVCKVFFSSFVRNSSMQTIEATNIPTYNNTWTSPSLKVYAASDQSGYMLYLAISLGIICVLLILLIILISRKHEHDGWLTFCLKRKQSPKRDKMESNSTLAYTSEETQKTEAHVDGMTVIGKRKTFRDKIAMLQKKASTEDGDKEGPLYGVVKKKQSQVEERMTKKQTAEENNLPSHQTPYTYVGADGTEYMEIGNCIPPQGEYSNIRGAPHLVQSKTYQVVTYASIDHLFTPQPKEVSGKRMTIREIAV